MSSAPQGQSLDILAIAAHRDDVEQTCGGTLLKAGQRGQHTGILDLTQGEMGTRGSAEDRAREASDAAKILGVTWRRALDIPDGRVENTWENRLKVAAVLRETRPRVVILPYWKGRHPDHYTASILGYEACFLAGLAKINCTSGSGSDGSRRTSREEAAAILPPHRPFKIIYATLYYDIRPSFVVDISEQFEDKFASILAYKTQFSDQEAGKDLFPAQEEIRSRVDAMARFYGMLGGVTHAEPFLQKEVGLVEDLLAIPVKSI
jgi:N-acetylglucosamine malate deacetylase 1